MNVNKLLKLVGPKLKQDELDVFLGEVLFADQSYGDSQIELAKQRQITDQLQKELEKIRYHSYLARCSSVTDADSASGKDSPSEVIEDLQQLCSLHQAEKQALLAISNKLARTTTRDRMDSNHDVIMQQIEDEESTFTRLLPSLSGQNQNLIAAEINKNKISGYRREKSEVLAQSVKSYSILMSQLSSVLRDQQNTMNQISKLMETTLNCSPRLSELSGQREVILSQIQHGISNLMVTLQSCRNDDAEYSDLGTTLEDMIEELNTSVKLIFGKVETGFKILFDVLEGTPRNTKSKEDIIVRLCRDTNSALNNDITSLKQAVMKVRTNLFHQNGDLLSTNSHLYASTQVFVENAHQCLGDLNSLVMELYDYRKETTPEEKNDAITRLVNNLHKQQTESLNLTAKLLTSISADYSKSCGEFYLLNQRAMMYGEIIREISNTAIKEEVLERYGGNATMGQLRQIVGEKLTQQIKSNFPRHQHKADHHISPKLALEPIVEVDSSDIVFVTSTTGLTSEQSIQNKQPAVISRSHGLLVSAQSYEAVMAVSSEVLNVVDRQESEQVAGSVRRMVTDSSTSTEDVRVVMASKQSQTDTQLTTHAISPTTETKHAQQKSELSSACWQKQGNIGGMEAKKARVELCAQFDTPFRKQANTVLLHNQRIRAAHQQNETLPTAHRKSVDEVMRQLEKNLKKLSGDRTKSSDLVDVTSQLSRQLNSFRKSFEGSNDGDMQSIKMEKTSDFTSAARTAKPDLITLMAQGSLGDQ